MTDDDQLETGLDDTGRLRLHTTCPAGHPSIQALTPSEWRDGLLTESLTFECLYCGAQWMPTAIQCRAILSEFDQ